MMLLADVPQLLGVGFGAFTGAGAAKRLLLFNQAFDFCVDLLRVHSLTLGLRGRRHHSAGLFEQSPEVPGEACGCTAG